MKINISDTDLRYQINADGLEQQLMLLQKMPDELNEELVKAVKKGNLMNKKDLVPRVKKFTGSTASSIGSRVKIFGPGKVRGIVGPSGRRAHITLNIIQYGRKPMGTTPWLHYLTDWVESKWGLSGDEGKQAAYKLARSIHYKGIKGEGPIVKDVLNKNKSAIEKLLQKAIDTVLSKLVVK